MPISKFGKLYYTPEQEKKAKENNNALEYALSRGYNLKRVGSRFILKEHDSMVFLPNGEWFWNSQNISGNAITFIMKYEQRTYTEAVCILSGEGYTANPILTQYAKNCLDENRELDIPEKDNSNYQIKDYLCNSRGISTKIFDRMVNEGKLYQDKIFQNVVMVGFDNEHNPKYISKRSIDKPGQKAFKADAKGSDKSYPFVIEGNNNMVVVCESPIEAMSYYSVCELLQSPLINCNIISLGGTSTNAIDRYLKEHTNIDTIVVATNNDKDQTRIINEKEVTINAGASSRQKIKDTYGNKYAIKMQLPKLNDWNDTIKALRKSNTLYKDMNAIKKAVVSKTKAPEK